MFLIDHLRARKAVRSSQDLIVATLGRTVVVGLPNAIPASVLKIDLAAAAIEAFALGCPSRPRSQAASPVYPVLAIRDGHKPRVLASFSSQDHASAALAALREALSAPARNFDFWAKVRWATIAVLLLAVLSGQFYGHSAAPRAESVAVNQSVAGRAGPADAAAVRPQALAAPASRAVSAPQSSGPTSQEASPQGFAGGLGVFGLKPR
jgi:hypothetical protein